MEHPWGRVEDGQSPREAVQRELREETGYRARTLRVFMRGAATATLAVERYLFLAKDLVHDPLPQDEGEEIKVVPVPLEKAYRMCLDGTIGLEFVALGIIRLYHEVSQKKRRHERT